MFEKKENTSASILLNMFTRVKHLGGLYVESLRLKTTEKITIILAAVAFYAVAMALGLVGLVFISLAAGRMLAMSIEPYLAYFIIAAFYMLLLLLAFLWRRRIFIDPIARFISRVLVEMPEEERVRQAQLRKEMVCTCNGYTLQYVDDTLPDEFYGGILGCEGRNFFWNFSAKTK